MNVPPGVVRTTGGASFVDALCAYVPTSTVADYLTSAVVECEDTTSFAPGLDDGVPVVIRHPSAGDG